MVRDVGPVQGDTLRGRYRGGARSTETVGDKVAELLPCRGVTVHEVVHLSGRPQPDHTGEPLAGVLERYERPSVGPVAHVTVRAVPDRLDDRTEPGAVAVDHPGPYHEDLERAARVGVEGGPLGVKVNERFAPGIQRRVLGDGAGLVRVDPIPRADDEPTDSAGASRANEILSAQPSHHLHMVRAARAGRVGRGHVDRRLASVNRVVEGIGVEYIPPDGLCPPLLNVRTASRIVNKAADGPTSSGERAHDRPAEEPTGTDHQGASPTRARNVHGCGSRRGEGSFGGCGGRSGRPVARTQATRTLDSTTSWRRESGMS